MSQSRILPISHVIDQEIIERYVQRQGKREFSRMLADQRELVGYQPDSSLRIWYNDSMTAYDSHWHSAMEMIVPVEGNYLVTVGERSIELTPGDIFLIPDGMLHTLRAPSRGGRFIFLFEFGKIWQIKGASCLASCVAEPVLINRSTCPSIYDTQMSILSEICWDYLQSNALRDITIYAKLLNFLLNYGRLRMAQESGDPVIPLSGQRGSAEKFNAVFSYLEQHFAEDLSLEHVAAVAGFSKYYFSRSFKQIYGCNFYEYLCHKRIKSSEALLMKPELSVSQIALQSGFSSVSTFNRTFKKLKGCTPTQYRGMFQVQQDNFREGMG